MNLLMDVGNSRIKWAFAEGVDLRDSGASAYVGQSLAGALETVPGARGDVARILICSVGARAINKELEDWCLSRYRVKPTFVRTARSGWDIINGYDRPGQLGADRWAALVGARGRTRRALAVVDCGTAITVDMLDETGRHRGGLIGAGIDTMRRGLYGATAGIPDEGEGVLTPLATDTRSAVTAGTLYAAAAYIDRARAALERECQQPLYGVITGGDAPRLVPLLQNHYQPVPNLVLEGLAVIADRQECLSGG